MMKDLISNFPPPKALQRYKRYLKKGMYKIRDTKIRYVICHINNMVEYLEKFLLFGAGQRLPEDKIIMLVEFSITKEWQR